MKGTKARGVLRAMQPAMLPELLTPAQVAAHLAVCRATVYKLAATGQLDHLRVGAQIRVPLAALTAYLARRPRREP